MANSELKLPAWGPSFTRPLAPLLRLPMWIPPPLAGLTAVYDRYSLRKIVRHGPG